MNREEWNTFQHDIRADAYAFKTARGGYPCFRRPFWHNGAEWTFTRFCDYGPKWQSYARQTEIRRRPIASLIMAELDCAAEFRGKMKRQGYNRTAYLRGAKISVKTAREWRKELECGWFGTLASA
jgi:hypothetical protein